MTNQLQLEGKFLGAGKTQMLGKDGTFAVRKFWLDITTNPDYPNTPEFSLKKDNVSLVDNLKKGDNILVTFRIEGRKWEKDDRKGVINDVSAYRIELIRTQSAATLVSTQNVPVMAQATALAPVAPAVVANGTPFANVGNQDDDVLPF